MNTFQEKLLFVEEEISRLFEGQRRRVVDINDKLIAAVAGTRFCSAEVSLESPAEVAVDNVEALVTHTHRARVFGRYLDSIRAKGTTEQAAFEHMENYVSRELISSADALRGHSSSWATNVQHAAELTALSDIARLFQDLREHIAG